jgi:hypothetical protein
MKLLWQAVARALQDSCSLVRLTEYVPGNPSIARANTPLQEEDGVYFDDSDNDPLTGADTIKLRQTLLIFHCVNSDIIKVADMVRAIEELYENEVESLAFFDISDKNILCNGSWITSMGSVRYDERLSKYRAMVGSVLVWSYK